jgi:hypothetical protein
MFHCKRLNKLRLCYMCSVNMYEGESVIVRNVRPLFAGAYACGWADATHTRSHSQSLVTFCCTFDLDSALLSLVSCRIHVRPSFSLAREKSSELCSIFDGFKLCQEAICMEGYQCCMERVFCRNGLPTNGIRGSKIVSQVLSTR